jgi:hypothetical protein
MENITLDDEQKRYTFVEKEKQQASLQFLLKEVLGNPQWLFGSSINEYVFPMQSTPDGYLENAPSLVLKNAQSYIFWELLENKRLTRMLENESLNGKNAFSVVELLNSLHQHLFGGTERGAIPNSSERSLQKGLVDALILSVSKENTNKEVKKLTDSHFLLDQQETGCSYHAYDTQVSQERSVSKAPNFYGSYADRISDAVSMKRGELLRIKDLLEKRQQTPDTATKYHYKDIILRINTALGIH